MASMTSWIENFLNIFNDDGTLNQQFQVDVNSYPNKLASQASLGILINFKGIVNQSYSPLFLRFEDDTNLLEGQETVDKPLPLRVCSSKFMIWGLNH
jgi:hypothetical protein